MRSAWHQTLREGYVREKNYINTGINQITLVKQFAELYILVGVWFTVRGEAVPHYILIPAFATLMLCMRTLGKLYDTAHLFEEEAEFGNRRNPAMRKLLKSKL